MEAGGAVGPVCRERPRPRAQACRSPRLGAVWQTRGAERTAVLMGHIGGRDPRLARAPGNEGLDSRSTGGRVPGRAVRKKGVSLEGRPESAAPSRCDRAAPDW